MTHQRALLPCALALALAACQSTPVTLSAPGPDVFVTIPRAEFPGADALLSGFDPRQGDDGWLAGDKVLYGLRLRKGDAVHRWLLLLDVSLGDRWSVARGDDGLDVSRLLQHRRWSYTARIGGERREMPIESRMALVQVSVHDPAGARLGRSLVQLPRDLLAHGLLPGIECALSHERGGGSFESFASEDDVRPMAHGLISLFALLNVVQNDDVLEDYFWLVVQKPSLWSVIAGFGVTASLTASLEKSVPVTHLPPDVPPVWPAYAMPLRVDVNDTTALLADVIAVDPARPYGLCAGIVAASARHPTEPDLRFDVQLLAARVGGAAAGAAHRTP